MEIRFALIAEKSYYPATTGRLTIAGVFQSITFETFPSAMEPSSMVFGLSCGPAEFGATKDMSIVLISPDGQRIHSAEYEIEVPADMRGRLRWTETFAIPLEELWFPTPGDYALAILINGDEKYSVPIVVSRGS